MSSARPGLSVGAAVGVGVGVGVGVEAGRGFGVGFGVGLGVGLGAVVPHRSAKITVHIFLPVGPLYAPIPTTSHDLPRMFARWPAEFMNWRWTVVVATSSG